MDWQLIEKVEPPKDGRRILFGYFDGGQYRYQVVRWIDDRFYAGTVKDLNITLTSSSKVTHWCDIQPWKL